MPSDSLTGTAELGTLPTGTQTVTLAVTSACNVEAASPFDRLHAEEERRAAVQRARWTKDKSKRTPRQKSPRASARAAVQAKVPPAAGAWRKEYCAYARWLPPHLASELIGAICNADSGGEPVRTTHETISAYTHDPVIQEWYGCKPVSPRQSERNLPKLKAAGYISCEVVHEYDTWTCKFRSRVVIWFTIENLRNLRAFYEDAVARKEMHKAAEAVRRQEFARELADTKASEETFRNGGQSGGQSGGESGGQSGGCCDSYLYRQPGTANKTATSSSGPGDDDAVLASSPPEEHRRGQAPRTPQEPGKGLSLSDYGAAVCRALGEHLADPMDPSLFPAAARDLLARLWPDPQDVPAREIAYGHLEDGWQRPGGVVSAKVGNEAAVLANRLRHADEALVRSWVERGAQRLDEIAAEQQEREAEAQRAAEAAEAQERAEREREQREADAAAKRRAEREQRIIENRIAEFAYEARRARETAARERDAEAGFNQRLPRYAELHGCTLDAAREASAEWGTSYVCRLKFVSSAITVKEMDAERANAKATFLAYVREHATQEKPVKVTELVEPLGINLGVVLGISNLLAADGLIVEKNYMCYPADPTQEAK